MRAPVLLSSVLLALASSCTPTVDPSSPGGKDDGGAADSGAADSGSPDDGGGAGTGGDGAVDADGDGWAAEEDCDDADATVHPGAVERCWDRVDNDCDGVRSCVDVVITVDATGAASGTGTWELDGRVSGDIPSETGSGVLVAAYTCTAGEPQVFGCSPGQPQEFTTSWADGHAEWDAGAIIGESTWEGSLYRSDAEGIFDWNGTGFHYVQRMELDVSELESAGR